MRLPLNSIAVILFFVSASASSREQVNLISNCSSPAISKISVPIYPDRSASETFQYHYKYIPANHRNATTIIVLPGGPGATLLQHSPDEPYSTMAIKSGWFNVIYTDPRGAGCNQYNFPSDALKTSYLANDVVLLISKLQLKNYLIAGVSYGTVLATEAASLIEKTNLAPPKAIILEGILGTGWPKSFANYIGEFDKEWKRVQSMLPVSAKQKLLENPLPFGLSAMAWGSYLYMGVISGDVPNKGHLLKLELQAFATGDSRALEYLRGKVSQHESVVAPWPQRLFQTVGCQELFKEWGYAVLKDGQLQSVPQPEICNGFDYEPYDAKNFLIKAPIFYFQGPYDHAAPYESARYHFLHQTKSNRVFITVAGAAHAPLTGSLRILGCTDVIWKTIDTDPGHLSQALNSCNWNIQIESARSNNW